MSEDTTTQYLTFVLSEEVFALDIVKVREVLELTSVSKLPRTPDYMKGVINIRGHAIPVVDMRNKLGMREAARTVDTCIIILEVRDGSGIHTIGAIVDSVREVVEIGADDIEPPPSLAQSVDAIYIKRLGCKDGRFIILLDVDSVFAGEVPATPQEGQSLAA